jgi:ABC-type multidrug transport system ATPase subunit
VVLEQATKRYGRRTVLHLERFELHRGQSLLIVGANGSGKSTLLRLLAGVTTASSGRVQRAAAFDALEIAYVPQAGGLHPNLTVAENLRQAVLLRGRREPDRLLERWYFGGVGLAEHLNTRFRDLSGGFQRLAALGCALATEPGILFVDEPFSGIDERHTRSVTEGLAAAMGQLELLVLTSHAAGDFPAAERVLELSGGEAA